MHVPSLCIRQSVTSMHACDCRTLLSLLSKSQQLASPGDWTVRVENEQLKLELADAREHIEELRTSLDDLRSQVVLRDGTANADELEEQVESLTQENDDLRLLLDQQMSKGRVRVVQLRALLHTLDAGGSPDSRHAPEEKIEHLEMHVLDSEVCSRRRSSSAMPFPLFFIGVTGSVLPGHVQVDRLLQRCLELIAEGARTRRIRPWDAGHNAVSPKSPPNRCAGAEQVDTSQTQSGHQETPGYKTPAAVTARIPSAAPVPKPASNNTCEHAGSLPRQLPFAATASSCGAGGSTESCTRSEPSAAQGPLPSAAGGLPSASCGATVMAQSELSVSAADSDTCLVRV